MSSPGELREPITIPEPTGVLAEPWSLRKVSRLAALFGPAAIVASVSIGAGETIVVVQAGSWAGYDLLWLVLASVLVKGICVTYLLGRYTAVSGEPIGQRLLRVPGPRGWLLVAIVVLELSAAGPLWAAIAKPSGDLIYFLIQAMLFGGDVSSTVSAAAAPSAELFGIAASTWKSVFAMAFILAALGTALNTSFKSLERQQLIICGILVLGTMIGTAMVMPDLSAAIVGALRIGHLPDPIPSWAPEAVHRQPLLTMTTTFGYVGGSVMCYIAYANWIGLHGWGLCGHPQIDQIRRRAAAGKAGDYLPNDPQQAARLRSLVMPLRWDVGLGALVLLIVTGSFMLAGAAVLYPQLASGKLPAAFNDWSLLTDQGHIWRSIHPALVWVYYICVLAALWGTLQAYPEIYARVTHDFLRVMRPGQSISCHGLQIILSAYVFVVASAFLWSNVQFATLTAIVSFLATSGGVALAMLAALYLNFQLPPLYRTRWWMLAAGVVAAVILVAVSCIAGWELVRGIVRS
jgi:Mn2+/Fe2+ NRAMP family transporter